MPTIRPAHTVQASTAATTRRSAEDRGAEAGQEDEEREHDRRVAAHEGRLGDGAARHRDHQGAHEHKGHRRDSAPGLQVDQHVAAVDRLTEDTEEHQGEQGEAEGGPPRAAAGSTGRGRRECRPARRRWTTACRCVTSGTRTTAAKAGTPSEPTRPWPGSTTSWPAGPLPGSTVGARSGRDHLDRSSSQQAGDGDQVEAPVVGVEDGGGQGADTASRLAASAAPGPGPRPGSRAATTAIISAYIRAEVA